MFRQLPAECYQFLKQQRDYVLLETSKFDSENYRTLLFYDPITILKINSLAEITHLFAEVETHLAKGYYLAGFLDYECGYHFEEVLSKLNPTQPVAWFGVYHQPLVFNHRAGCFENLSAATAAHFGTLQFESEAYNLSQLKLMITNSDYLEKLQRIREDIMAGDVYQIDFTTKYKFNFSGSVIDLYNDLRKQQPVPYGALINYENRQILSFSPELFFKLKASKIMTKPMKGTAPRGKTSHEDAQLHEWLRHDEKNRAENLMIVDLLRNDLGRIASIGSVAVPEIFTVARYPTLFQMTSTVTAELPPNLKYYDIFKALFPCGSVTGAPKIRAMQIINELENEPRGVYTGAIGYFAPGGKAVFNVPIRTLVINGERGEMGVGSGIVYDSVPEAEYAECCLKAKFLRTDDKEFKLIETILWDQGYRMLSQHIVRIQASAEFFDFNFEANALTKELYRLNLDKQQRFKVRVLLDRAGWLSISNVEVEPEKVDEQALKVGIANARTNSGDRFLFHKTTRRQLYDQTYQRSLIKGFTDVIFRNEQDQITEGAISNLFIQKNGHWYTPPLVCGLLNGVYRQKILLEQSEAQERVLVLDDLRAAEAVYICNAVRGLRKVMLVEEYI